MLLSPWNLPLYCQREVIPLLFDPMTWCICCSYFCIFLALSCYHLWSASLFYIPQRKKNTNNYGTPSWLQHVKKHKKICVTELMRYSIMSSLHFFSLTRSLRESYYVLFISIFSGHYTMPYLWYVFNMYMLYSILNLELSKALSEIS